VRRLLVEVDGLRRDGERTHAMRAASARLGRPAAAADIAALIAGLVTAAPPPAASMSYADGDTLTGAYTLGPAALGWQGAGVAHGAGAAQAREAGRC
jgi:hypothetical protein